MNDIQEGMNQSADLLDIEIDFGRIFRSLLHYAWFIVLLSMIGAGVMYGYARYVLSPVYTSTASLFIHDKSITASEEEIILDSDDTVRGYNTVGGSTITYLQNTYRRTLFSDTTLNIVIQNLQLEYDCDDLQKMMTASFRDYPYFDITITANDPIEAADIANELASVLYTQVTKIVGGSDLTHVDAAVPPELKSGPSIRNHVFLGFAVGLAFSCGIIVLIELTNNKINNEEYLINRYGLPVLASITDFDVSRRNGKKYYKKYGKDPYSYS